MSVKHNKHPIDQTFTIWIKNYPESYHPCDMERFYTFVKTICRYSRKTKGAEWLEKEIKNSGSRLSDDDIENYCSKFVELQEFYRTKAMPIYPYE